MSSKDLKNRIFVSRENFTDSTPNYHTASERTLKSERWSRVLETFQDVYSAISTFTNQHLNVSLLFSKNNLWFKVFNETDFDLSLPNDLLFAKLYVIAEEELIC